MRVEVAFRDERLEFEVPEGRLVGVWQGPPDLSETEVRGLVLEALENPLGFPPLRQAVVPGDRVVIPWDPDVPSARSILGAICEVLTGAGVEAESIRVLASGPVPDAWSGGLPPGVEMTLHDPEDRAGLAYLAST
ncbi:MAG: DUF2088 domain-containing protein, partial [Isosphaeraceae bacterium]|nr:DUF2088 domain-containing protein [Isosphaeraceae bacterium]